MTKAELRKDFIVFFSVSLFLAALLVNTAASASSFSTPIVTHLFQDATTLSAKKFIVKELGRPIQKLGTEFVGKLDSFIGKVGNDAKVRNFLVRSGENGVNVVNKYGDETADLITAYGDEAGTFIGKWGDDGMEVFKKGGNVKDTLKVTRSSDDVVSWLEIGIHSDIPGQSHGWEHILKGHILGNPAKATQYKALGQETIKDVVMDTVATGTKVTTLPDGNLILDGIGYSKVINIPGAPSFVNVVIVNTTKFPGRITTSIPFY